MTQYHPRFPRQVKIVGGYDALPHNFPYQVHLDKDNSFFCGGSIINAFVILTAAHCLRGKSSPSPNHVKVVAGDHDRTIGEGTEQIRNVERFIIHKDYDSDTKEHDIALVIMSEALNFNSFVQPIAYPRTPQEFSGIATVTGWGIQSNGIYADRLQKVEVPIVQREACRQNYSSVNTRITGNMMCAGVAGKDSCSGDSGGPLACRIGSAANRLLCGVVTHGKGCGLNGFPGIYADVSKYSTWIDESLAKTINNCKRDQFRCVSDGSCIHSAWKCDADRDCSDGSDEENCPVTTTTTTPKPSCGRGYFKCLSDQKCINYSWKCDNDRDCSDGSDEKNCPVTTTTTTPTPSCGRGYFKCLSDQKCINYSWKCDNERDCIDGSDEVGCLTTTTTSRPICGRLHFQCISDGKCISSLWKCDNDRDCSDGSDEAGCPDGRTPL